MTGRCWRTQEDHMLEVDLVSRQDNSEQCFAADIIQACRRQGLYIAAAESLTGGLLADSFVKVSGASDVFLGSAVTYDIHAKAKVLHVDTHVLQRFGAVCTEVSCQMAYQAAKLYAGSGWQYPKQLHSDDDITIIGLSTTGVAGPGPQGDQPAGLAYVGCYLSDACMRNINISDEDLALLKSRLLETVQTICDVQVLNVADGNVVVCKICMGDCGRELVRRGVVCVLLQVLWSILSSQAGDVGQACAL